MDKRLSPREEDVLRLLTHGLTNREIAEQLGISWRTVDAYLRRIYDKINAKGRVEAVVWYIQRYKKDNRDTNTEGDT